MLAIAGYLPGRALGNADNFHHVFFECDYQPVTYTLGIGYHYMFTNYFGAGASLGFLGDNTLANGLIDVLGYIIDSDYDPYDPYYEAKSFPNSAFYFQPSLYVSTPQLHISQSVGIGASMMPWLRMSTNHYASDHVYINGQDIEKVYRCRTFSVGVRVGLTLYINEMGISLGYTISNTDVMREYRSNGRGSTSKPAQGFYIDVAFNF